MKLNIPEKLYTLAKACSFPLYAVGGFVRDGLAGLHSESADVDICAPVDADTFLKAAQNAGAIPKTVYRNTGTVKLSLGEEEYEFASFRSDEYVRGIHKPVNTFFTDDITLDARRRDFKCNAVYYDIKAEKFIDPLGGIADIENKRLTTVADSDKVFGEDGLRLMRLARQSAQTGFVPDEQCVAGAKHNCRLISDCSVERIYAELHATLHADLRYGIKYAQYHGLKLLDITGVLDVILPELAAGRGMKQRADFHNYDVLEHSLRAVMYADNCVRLAALLHDIGKPYCMNLNGNYHNHEKEGARIAGEVCERLNVPKKLAAETVRLCELHMYDLKGDARQSKIRRLIVRNIDIFEKLLAIKQADFSACCDDTSQAPCVTKWKGIYGEMVNEGAPLNLKQLCIKGDRLIRAGVPPEKCGKVLNLLLEECALDPSLNKSELLLQRATNMAKFL